MRKYLLVLLICFVCIKSESATIPDITLYNNVTSIEHPVNRLPGITKVKIKTLEKILGRKLKLKEKAAIKLYQWKVRKGIHFPREESNPNKGRTAMILGIVAIASLFIPYVNIASLPCAILAIIFGNQARKADPKDSKALTGVILGWVTIGIFILAVAILIIVLSSWTMGGWG